MATILRSFARQGRHLQIVGQSQPHRVFIVPLLHHKALISTSKKNKDVGAVVQPMEKSGELKRLAEHFGDTSEKEENWTSFGYQPGDRDLDWFLHHAVLFATVTIGFTLACFITSYMPDYKFQDWAHREAFLELERRERLGLPLVDPDYIKIDDLELPLDEEIGEQEIII